MRFHIPFEHGAWWSFFSTLLGGAVYALALGHSAMAVLFLGLGLSGGFLAQDWAQALVGALLQQRSQAVSQWQAWQGWALLGGSLICLAVALKKTLPLAPWMLFLALLTLAYVFAIEKRVTQGGRGRSALPFAAMLLAVPALAMAALAHGFDRQAFEFFFWPAVYYPAVTLTAQSYIRGLPQGWRYSGPFLLGALGLTALYVHAWVAAAAIFCLAGLVARELQGRWKALPSGLPPGQLIRSFGKKQAFWGVGLTILWIVEFLKTPW